MKIPWKIISVAVISLETIGKGAKATPDFLTGQKTPRNSQKKVIPSNIASGVAFGSKAFVESLISAVAGVVLEPVKGAKTGGFKGGAVGFGKGILGLIFKPVAGTLELVT